MVIQGASGGPRGHATQTPVNLGFLTYGLDRPLSGIGRYTVELGQRLADCQDVAVTLINPFSEQPPGFRPLSPHIRIHGRLLPTLMTAGPAQIAFQARKYGLDVVHDPHGVSPFLIPGSIGRFARVVTIHDMIPFMYPETHARLTNILFRHYIPRTLRFVDRIITVSEASRHDIVRFYRIPIEKVSVIPCGVSASFTPSTDDHGAAVARKYGIAAPYILTVGALQSRKNLETLFEAYALLRKRGNAHKLVVVGKKAWKTEGIFARLRELGLEDEVILTGYVADDDLPALYSAASVFVFPSLYEGFGLPPLEAMACGTPVIVSNSSSLPEVVGDAGLLIDPLDIKGFADAIERLSTDARLHHELRERGLRRASSFTWERAAAAHIKLYQALAGR